MWDWLRYLIPAAIGVFGVAELVRWWLAGVSVQGWIDLAGNYVLLMAIAVAWMIADRRARAKPPTDGPEADYRDPPDVQRNG